MKKWLIPLTVAAFCVSACDDKNSTQATAEKPQVENTQSQKCGNITACNRGCPMGNQ